MEMDIPITDLTDLSRFSRLEWQGAGKKAPVTIAKAVCDFEEGPTFTPASSPFERLAKGFAWRTHRCRPLSRQTISHTSRSNT